MKRVKKKKKKHTHKHTQAYMTCSLNGGRVLNEREKKDDVTAFGDTLAANKIKYSWKVEY